MKKSTIIIAFIFISNAIFSQTINFLDINFKNRLLSASSVPGPTPVATDFNGYNMVIDSNSNGEIEVSEAQAVFQLSVNIAGISNLIGIEYFTNLIYLDCSYNLLTTLDVTALTNLVEFKCYHNNLNFLNINGITSLKILSYGTNNLPNLNFSANVNLIEIYCGENNISNIDISQILDLRVLICYYNNITSIDVSNQLNLRILECRNNLLTNIDLSNNKFFIGFNCSNNPLINLNIKRNRVFDYNTMFNMNFSNCPNLINVCADAVSLNDIQNKVNGYGYTNCSVNSNCNLSTESNSFAENLNVYPNPAKNTLNFDFKNKEGQFATTIFNSLGQIVLNENNQNQIDISNLIAGIYVVDIKTADKVFRTKFSKTN